MRAIFVLFKKNFFDGMESLVKIRFENRQKKGKISTKKTPRVLTSDGLPLGSLDHNFRELGSCSYGA